MRKRRGGRAAPAIGWSTPTRLIRSRSILDLLGHRRSRIRVAMFIGGVTMAALAYGLEYFSAVINYPYNSGGRPLDAWPAFMLVPFATGILLAAISGFATLLVRNRPAAAASTPCSPSKALSGRARTAFILALEPPRDDDDPRRAIDFFKAQAQLPCRGSTDERPAPQLRRDPRLRLRAHGLRSQHDAAAQAHDLRADVVVAGRRVGASTAGQRRRARRRGARRDRSKTPPPVTAALLARGRERFGIFCSPCHGLAGDGDGIIVAHGFPAPPSYHIDRLLAAPAQHFYDVISHGYGVMFAYDDRVPPHDRWAIAAYIRALQLSRRAKVAEVPDAAEHVR